MKKKSLAHYAVVVTSELTTREVEVDFDSHLIDKISLFVSNLVGRSIEFCVEEIELLSVENLEEE